MGQYGWVNNATKLHIINNNNLCHAPKEVTPTIWKHPEAILTIYSHIKKRTDCNGFNQKPKNVFCLHNLKLQNNAKTQRKQNKITTEVKEAVLYFQLWAWCELSTSICRCYFNVMYATFVLFVIYTINTRVW